MALAEKPLRERTSRPAKGSSVSPTRDWTRLWQGSSFVAAVAVWWLVAQSGWLSQDALPSPGSVFSAARDLLPSAVFWTAVGETLRGAVVGLALAALVGIPLGLITGTYAAVEKSTRVLVDVLRSFP